MKKYLKLLLLLPVILFSCQDKDVDPLFDGTPEARTEARIAEVKEELVANKTGWLAFLRFDNFYNGIYYNVIFQENNRAVVQYYDFSTGMVKSRECEYSLRYTQQLDLVFNTASPFSDLVEEGGDFRFELKEKEDGIYYFNTRNDREELGIGDLRLSRIATTEAFSTLMASVKLSLDDAGRSFYRILTVNGSDQKYLFKIPNVAKAYFFADGGESLLSAEMTIEVKEDGIYLQEPLEVAGKQITGFVYNETDHTFDALNGTAKIGKLGYGDKPFTFYGAALSFLYASSREWYAVQEYSSRLDQALDILRGIDGTFQYLQIYTSADLPIVAYYRLGEPHWIMYYMNYGFVEDGITFNFDGTDQNGLVYYQQLGAAASFNMFMDESFTIVPLAGKYYLVQDADPSIWAIANPQ